MADEVSVVCSVASHARGVAFPARCVAFRSSVAATHVSFLPLIVPHRTAIMDAGSFVVLSSIIGILFAAFQFLQVSKINALCAPPCFAKPIRLGNLRRETESLIRQ